jgi:hypothetical protein
MHGRRRLETVRVLETLLQAERESQGVPPLTAEMVIDNLPSLQASPSVPANAVPPGVELPERKRSDQRVHFVSKKRQGGITP